MKKAARTSVDWNRVLPFIPVFTQPGYTFATWQHDERALPYCFYSEEVLAFIQATYDAGVIYEFDWGSWQEQAERYYANPERLANADLDVLRNLLTLHIRKERFVEGHLAMVLESVISQTFCDARRT